MSKTFGKHRSAKRDARKRAAFHAVAEELDIHLDPLADAVPQVVRKKAALDLALRQTKVAVPALSRLAGSLYRQAHTADPSHQTRLRARSEEAWRLSRLFRRCQQSLTYAYDPERQALDIAHTESCKVNVCPLCTRVKARNRWHDVTAAIAKIRAEQPADKFVLLTLTKPKSCEVSLQSSLKRLSTNVTRLLKTPQLKRIVRGYLMTVEINYDPKTDLYHDHCHLLLHVPATYGPDQPNLWLTQKTLVAMWSAIYGSDQKLVVDVRFAGAADEAEIGKSMNELCKYLSSPLSLFKQDPEQPEAWSCHARAMLTLAMATHGLRLMRCGGSVANARRALKRRDTDPPSYELWED